MDCNNSLLSSVHLALHLPEILDKIFGYLSQSELYHCSLVCTQWSELGVESLWKYNTPDIFVLQQLHKDHVLEKYLPSMRHFRLVCKDWCNLWHLQPRSKTLDQHEFAKDFPALYPRLKAVSLSIETLSEFNTEEYLGGFFQPCLRWINFSSECDEYEILARLQTDSPNLESICFAPSQTVDSRMNQLILSFLSTMPQLREITGLLRSTPNTTLIEVSKLPSLEILSINGFDSVDWADFLLNSTPDDDSPFPSLKELDLRGRNVSNLAMSRLLSYNLFDGLQVLTLHCEVSTKSSSVVSQLSKCPQLTTVTLRFRKNEKQRFDEMGMGEIAPENVKTFFRECQQLRECKIYTHHPPLPVKGTDVCSTFMLLPRIRTLDIPWSCSLGARELATLRDSCPRLTELNLEKSTLNYGQFAGRDSPRNSTIKRFLGIRDERRAHWEPLKLPKSSLSETQRSEGEKAEIFRRVLPAVYRELPKLYSERTVWNGDGEQDNDFLP